jgi:hypothetical protein
METDKDSFSSLFNKLYIHSLIYSKRVFSRSWNSSGLLDGSLIRLVPIAYFSLNVK